MKRIQFIDSLKGFAIFCVLWGHSIQHFRNGDDAFQNPMFELIYSFHMPLFFLISGFFFKSALKLNFKEFLSKKTAQLLLPCFVWAVIFLGISLGYNFFHSSGNVDWLLEFKKIVIPFKWPFWFLKQLFLSYLLTYVFYKVIKNEWLAFILLIGFVLVAPYSEMQRFLLPIFLVGILLKDTYHFVLAHSNAFLFASGFIFVGCLVFWEGSYTIYVTGFPPLINRQEFNLDLSNITISLFRLLTGLAGSIFFFVLFQQLYEKNWIHSSLERIGRHTLTIYILQVILIELDRIPDFQIKNIWIYNLVISPLASIVVLLISIGLIYLLSKSKRMGYLLFGSSFRKIPQMKTKDSGVPRKHLV